MNLQLIIWLYYIVPAIALAIYTPKSYVIHQIQNLLVQSIVPVAVAASLNTDSAQNKHNNALFACGYQVPSIYYDNLLKDIINTEYFIENNEASSSSSSSLSLTSTRHKSLAGTRSSGLTRPTPGPPRASRT